MLVKSVRIIEENIGFYLFIAFLIVVVGTLSSLGYLGDSGHVGMLVAITYLSANLPLMILRNISLTTAVAKARESGGKATYFKMGLIAVIMAVFTIFVSYNRAASLPPGAEPTTTDNLTFVGILVVVLPMFVTFLGSWIPAGIIKKETGFLKAIGRGLMSIHTVYWRLVLAFGAFFLVSLLIIFPYVLAFGHTPSIATPSGGIDPWSISCWYLVAFAGLALLTYANVVVCLCYARAEKIDLDEALQTPTAA